jgi:uncharacterized membrane protein YeaQ/YmgE (transglycosylase-associated protein family)
MVNRNTLIIVAIVGVIAFMIMDDGGSGGMNNPLMGIVGNIQSTISGVIDSLPLPFPF